MGLGLCGGWLGVAEVGGYFVVLGFVVVMFGGSVHSGAGGCVCGGGGMVAAVVTVVWALCDMAGCGGQWQ